MDADEVAPPLAVRPSKVVAVHLSYESRAAQRGRFPKNPSYFLKPASSLASSGGTVERPAGTELLAFEGEIALVIGAPARWVAPEDAWGHVAAITAANDFGIYDLRKADRGSNVRSKGGDGFTPIGPELIGAREVDQQAIRVRTWVNGELKQDGTTAGLIFPLSRLVADLSQHFTLRTGDVILTGTPAGSTVVSPGDVVEVEVDVPGGASSGRLVTTVTQGKRQFSDVGARPEVDEVQRAEAWGYKQTLSAEVRDKLERAPVASLSAQLRKRGLNNIVVDGVRPNRKDAKIVGTARTLRFVPHREDLFETHGGGYNAQKRLFDSVDTGEVIVIEARGEKGAGTLGDILALRALARGAAGVVTDGGVRDYDAVAETGLPVFSAGPHPAVLGRKHVPWDTDITIACGGTTVQPGDVIVGDTDGVIVIPPHLAREIAEAALAQENEDAWVAEQVRQGHPVKGLFPPDAQWRRTYESTLEQP